VIRRDTYVRELDRFVGRGWERLDTEEFVRKTSIGAEGESSIGRNREIQRRAAPASEFVNFDANRAVDVDEAEEGQQLRCTELAHEAL
jgi:hypothetical protein